MPFGAAATRGGGSAGISGLGVICYKGLRTQLVPTYSLLLIKRSLGIWGSQIFLFIDQTEFGDIGIPNIRGDGGIPNIQIKPSLGIWGSKTFPFIDQTEFGDPKYLDQTEFGDKGIPNIPFY